MPERTALMTLALESPETRQNTARTPGSDPANARTCACPPTSSLSLPSTPGTAYTPTGSCLLRQFRFPFRENSGVAAMRLHTRFSLWEQSQMRVPGVDHSTSAFSKFPAYRRVKLDSRSQLAESSSKQVAEGMVHRGWKKKDNCGCRKMYSSNTHCFSKVQTGNLHMEIIFEDTRINILNCTLKRLQQLGRGKWALWKQERL